MINVSRMTDFDIFSHLDDTELKYTNMKANFYNGSVLPLLPYIWYGRDLTFDVGVLIADLSPISVSSHKNT